MCVSLVFQLLQGLLAFAKSLHIYTSKDVIFNELKFPYPELFPTSPGPATIPHQYFNHNPILSHPSTNHYLVVIVSFKHFFFFPVVAKLPKHFLVL